MHVGGLRQAAAIRAAADPSGMIATEPPTPGVDFESLTVELDPVFQLMVLIRPARVLVDSSPVAVEGRGLLVT